MKKCYLCKQKIKSDEPYCWVRDAREVHFACHNKLLKKTSDNTLDKFEWNCSGCDKKLDGTRDVREHIEKTGHEVLMGASKTVTCPRCKKQVTRDHKCSWDNGD